jgi:hypothetical protein
VPAGTPAACWPTHSAPSDSGRACWKGAAVPVDSCRCSYRGPRRRCCRNPDVRAFAGPPLSVRQRRVAQVAAVGPVSNAPDFRSAGRNPLAHSIRMPSVHQEGSPTGLTGAHDPHNDAVMGGSRRRRRVVLCSSHYPVSGKFMTPWERGRARDREQLVFVSRPSSILNRRPGRGCARLSGVVRGHPGPSLVSIYTVDRRTGWRSPDPGLLSPV